MDYSEVSGCIVFKPAAYGAWQTIMNATDAEFKKAGIENVYFPLLIPEKLLKKEQEHMEGFTPEVAWVTQSGETKFQETARDKAHIRGNNVCKLLKMGQVMERPPDKAQPVEQRAEMGVQAPDPVHKV